MVIAMMNAATTQAAAIHNPPKRIQRMFSNMETGGMRFLSKSEQPQSEQRALAPHDLHCAPPARQNTSLAAL
jgi:hypothetical protein